MFHLIKYSVIRKVKNFSMLFWPCMFPLILGTLFYFAFGNISESDFETVQAAFVYLNICHRLLGEEVPFQDLDVKKGILGRLFGR